MLTHTNYSLASLNTFRIDVKADHLVDCLTMDDLDQFLYSAEFRGLPLFILGGGSNVLFTKNFEGVVLRYSQNSIDFDYIDDDQVIVKVSGGFGWDEFVQYCVNHGWGGLENLSLIPGMVGSSPIQNIGAYGVEIKDRVVEVEAIDLATRELRKFTNEECRFGYRDSIFKRELKGRVIIVSVTFRLSRDPLVNVTYEAFQREFQGIPPEDISVNMVREAVIRIRTSKLPDPLVIGNAGSFFKNPSVGVGVASALKASYPAIPLYKQQNNSYKVSAGWLIEQCGWKGKRIGNVGVYEKQALVLVNYGGASGQEVLGLADSVRGSVNERFGINLETEVNIV